MVTIYSPNLTQNDPMPEQTKGTQFPRQNPQKKRKSLPGEAGGECGETFPVQPTDVTLKLTIQSQREHGWTIGYCEKWREHLPRKSPMKLSLFSQAYNPSYSE